MDIVTNILQSIDQVLLPKLSKNCEESDHHVEYDLRKENLNKLFPEVIKLLKQLDLNENPTSGPKVLAAVLILFEELQCEGPWNKDISKDLANDLTSVLESLYEVALTDIVRKQSFYDDIFNECMEKIHQKLTPEDFKRYPATIEVYWLSLENIKEYSVALNPLKTLPASLLLIDDYVTSHKIKGLKCCASILQNLKPGILHHGNYYEVVYSTLKKSLLIEYVDVNKLSHGCLLDLLKCLPEDVKIEKSEDLFLHTLKQIYGESNLLRKANSFRFTKSLIEISGVNCVRRKKLFNTIMCENLEICANVAVAEMLLLAVLECLEEWIRYCWCVWNLKLSSDQALLSLLLKIMYININNEQISIKLQEILETLICISTKEDQKQILSSLESRKQLTSPEFLKRLGASKKAQEALNKHENLCTCPSKH